MDVFEADLAAFADWWLTGGRKPRRQSTLDGYSRQIRHWWAWTCDSIQGQSTTPTLRGVNAYLRVVRQQNEHTAVLFVRAVKAWSKWLVADGEVAEDPLATLMFITSPEPTRTRVAELNDIDAQLATCSGTTMEGVRDRTIIMVLRETGMRRGELALMEWDRVDLAERTIWLPPSDAKTGKGRLVGIEPDTIRAIHKYRRRLLDWECTNRRYASDRVWIGRLGPMTSNGIGQMLQRRSTAAGVHAPAHSCRRGYAIRFLRRGGSEMYLRQTAGWTTGEMVKRYTKAKVSEEALAAQRAFNAAENSSQSRRGRSRAG